MLGSIQHIFGRALFDDLPVSHNDNPVSNFSRELDLMGYDDHRRPAFRSEMLHHIKHFDGHLWIEGTGWLIKQHQRRMHSQGPGDRHTLLLTT